MSSIDQLKLQILKIISNDNFDLETLLNILKPIPIFSDNIVFQEKINEIVSILIQDRDGNNIFTIDDLKLMSKDIMAITTLTSSIILILGMLPELDLQYEKGASEELIFKILIYIFIFIIYKKTKINWTF